VAERLLLAAAALVSVPALLLAYITIVEAALSRPGLRRLTPVRPWLWLAPSLALLLLFLLVPVIQTLQLSLLDARSEHFVGLANYRYLFADAAIRQALRNNALWLVLFTSLVVGLGLLIATLTERVRYTALARATVFLPMAVSFVAAGVIWRFVYDYRPAGAAQTGVLNALLTLLPGSMPHAWLTESPINDLALIAAAVWSWTGFGTIILAAGLQGIPVEVVEAARIDGAGEWRVFWRVIAPLLTPAISVCTTVMVVTALKAFDIVYVMTNGAYGTELIASRMYKEMFSLQDFGRASALAVILLLAIAPVMLLNVRRLRGREAQI
jgi:alpha-glucoside transport system permease protein